MLRSVRDGGASDRKNFENLSVGRYENLEMETLKDLNRQCPIKNVSS